MPDQRPERTTRGERDTLLGLLRFQRQSLARKVEGVSEDDARRRFVASDTTLLWLVKHVTMAEVRWFAIRFAGQDVVEPAEAVGPGDTVTGAVAAYRAACTRSDAIVAAAPTLDEPCVVIDEGPNANLRWVLGHMLEETARHAGHADILRELLDGSTGR
jgi:hypothetical protein